MRSSVAIAAVLAALAATTASARAVASPRDQWMVATKILVRSLAFDRALADRVGDDVTVAVLYDANVAPSVVENELMVIELQKLSQRKIAGRPIRVRALDCSVTGALDDQLAGGTIDAVYVTRGLGERLAAIVRATRFYDITSLTATGDYVRRGVAIGVAFDRGRPKLIVNLKASKAEGMSLSAPMLRLAQVIR